MNISNSSIMLGEQFRDTIGPGKLGALFVKVHPEEEFDSPDGSSDTVFDLSNVVMNGIGLWDLNTIGDAIDDTEYENIDREAQEEGNNYTELSHSNTQGCGQFIAPFVSMQDIRWTQCEVMTLEEVTPDIQIEKFVSVDEGKTWEPADTPPGPFLAPDIEPQFRFIVTNIGNVTLTDIEIVDDVLGLIGTIETLNSGNSEEFIIS